jgi:phosphatidylglycerol:prolipoprotein diacylglycerol transferase
MIFPDPQAGAEPRHPSQLYEAGLEGLVLFLYVQHRLWRDRLVQKAPGQLVGEMLILYSLARIFCEKFREPDFGEKDVLGLSKGQFYSFGLIAAGVGLLVIARSRAARVDIQSES